MSAPRTFDFVSRKGAAWSGKKSREQMRRLFRDEWLTEKGSISRCVCEGGACFRGGRGFIFFVRAGVHDWMSRRPDDVLGITDARVETVYDVAKRVLVFLWNRTCGVR
jgi:hypothetical protein